jgi:predicted outer membrane repeat protein
MIPKRITAAKMSTNSGTIFFKDNQCFFGGSVVTNVDCVSFGAASVALAGA